MEEDCSEEKSSVLRVGHSISLVSSSDEFLICDGQRDYAVYAQTKDEHVVSEHIENCNFTIVIADEVSSAFGQTPKPKQEKQARKIISYGSVIQLVHADSGRFLQCNSKGRVVAGKESNGKQSWFKIMPKYRVRAEGQKIFFNDEIILVSVFTECPIDFTTKQNAANYLFNGISTAGGGGGGSDQPQPPQQQLDLEQTDLSIFSGKTGCKIPISIIRPNLSTTNGRRTSNATQQQQQPSTPGEPSETETQPSISTPQPQVSTLKQAVRQRMVNGMGVGGGRAAALLSPTANSTGTSLRIVPFENCVFQPDVETVMAGQIVVLYHQDAEGSLASTTFDEHGVHVPPLSSVSLNNDYMPNGNEAFRYSIDSLWRIEPIFNNSGDQPVVTSPPSSSTSPTAVGVPDQTPFGGVLSPLRSATAIPPPIVTTNLPINQNSGVNQSFGGPVSFGAPMRLRHIVSGLFLGVFCDELALVTQRMAGSFVFQPHTPQESSRVLSHRTVLRLCDETSGMFIQLSGSDKSTRKMGFSQTAKYEDAFLLLQIPHSELNLKLDIIKRLQGFRTHALVPPMLRTTLPIPSSLSHIAIPHLSFFISLCTQEPQKSKKSGFPTSVSNIQDGGNSAQEILARDGAAQRAQQKLLFELRAPLFALGFLRSVEKATEMSELSKKPNLFLLCKLCYRFLRQVVKDSPDLAATLAQHIPFMETQLGYSLRTAEAIMEVMRFNTRYLNALEISQVNLYLSLLAKEVRKKKPGSGKGYLNLLCAMCLKDEDTAIPRNQLLVSNAVFTNHINAVMQTKVDESTGVLMIDPSRDGSFLPLEELCEKATKESASADIIAYFERQINLYSILCLGGNTDSTSKIVSIIPRSAMIEAMTSQTFPFLLRTAFAKLLLCTLPHQRSARPLDAVKRVLGSGGLQKSSATSASWCGSDSSLMMRVKTFVLLHLLEHEEPCSEQEMQFLLQVIKLCRHLTVAGLFTVEDIKDLFKVLLSGFLKGPWKETAYEDLPEDFDDLSTCQPQQDTFQDEGDLRGRDSVDLARYDPMFVLQLEFRLVCCGLMSDVLTMETHQALAAAITRVGGTTTSTTAPSGGQQPDASTTQLQANNNSNEFDFGFVDAELWSEILMDWTCHRWSPLVRAAYTALGRLYGRGKDLLDEWNNAVKDVSATTQNATSENLPRWAVQIIQRGPSELQHTLPHPWNERRQLSLLANRVEEKCLSKKQSQRQEENSAIASAQLSVELAAAGRRAVMTPTSSDQSNENQNQSLTSFYPHIRWMKYHFIHSNLSSDNTRMLIAVLTEVLRAAAAAEEENTESQNQNQNSEKKNSKFPHQKENSKEEEMGNEQKKENEILSRKVELQNIFNDCGIASVAVLKFDRRNPSLVHSLLCLCIEILDGGNTSVQETILKFFLSQQHEQFFWFFSERMRDAVEMIKTKGSDADENDLEILRCTLRFLQLLCEGHNLGVQNYLRQQPDNLCSYDLIRSCVTLFPPLLEHLNGSTFPVAMQLLNSLTEFCQGPCPGNQSVLVRRGVCQSISSIFGIRKIPQGMSSEDMQDLRTAAITHVFSLLEGNNSVAVASVITSSLDIGLLLSELDSLWQKPDDSAQELAFSIFALLKVLAENDASGKMIKVLRQFAGFETMSAKTGCIEIHRDGRLEKVHFKIPEVSAFLTEEAKSDFMNTVDRDSPIARVTGLFDTTPELIYHMLFRERLSQNPSLQFLVSLGPKLHTISLLIAFAINFLLLFVVDFAGGDSQNDEKNFTQKLSNGTISILGVLQLMCSCAMLAEFVVVRSPILSYRANPPEDPWSPVALSLTPSFLSESFFATLVHFIASVLGNLFSPLFFSLHLLSVIEQNPHLKNVIQAVTLNGRTLLLTACLGLIFVYLYAIVGFQYFHDGFKDDDGNLLCSSIFECFVHTFGIGLRGDELQQTSFEESGVYWRVAFDLSFFILVNTVLMNIIFGIIIDTFAELRDARQSVEQDMRQKCFVCGLDAQDFDRHASGFHHHILHDHNVWNYVYFVIYLHEKDVTEYTGQESYVAEMIKNRDLGFFPLNKALCLNSTHTNAEDSEEVQSDEQEGSLASLRNEVATLTKLMQEMVARNKKNEGASVGAPTPKAATESNVLALARKKFVISS